MLDRLNEIILDLRTRLDRQPTFGWAVVTSVAPLLIRYDGQTEAIAGTPASLVSGLMIGDRVWCVRAYRREIVLGRGKGKPRSGVITASTGTLTQIGATGMYGTTLDLTIPAVAPDGSRMRIDGIVTGTGYGTVSLASVGSGLTSTPAKIRFTQVGSAQSQALEILWEIVPIG